MESSKNEKSFNATPINVLNKSMVLTDLLFISTKQMWFDLIWYNHIIPGSTGKKKKSEVAEEQRLQAEGTHVLWLQSSTIWSQSFSLWGNGWREVAQCNLAERELSTIVSPTDLLREKELCNCYVHSSWDCLASCLGHASENHDNSGRRCLLGIKQMTLLSLSLFSSFQNLMRMSVHKCYHLFL